MTLSRTARVWGSSGGRSVGAWLLIACAAVLVASLPMVAAGQTALTLRAARAMKHMAADADNTQAAVESADAPPEAATDVTPARPAFGAAAGKAGRVVTLEAMPSRQPRMILWILAGITAAEVITVGIAAMSLSRRKNALGHVQKSMTMGTKVALASGGIATLVLASVTLNTWEQSEAEGMEIAVRSARARMPVMAGLGESMTTLNAAVRGVCAAPTDESLRTYSDAAATVDAQLKVAIAASSGSEQTKALVAIATGMASSEGTIREMMKSVNERRTLAFGSLPTVADRTRGLMEEATGPGVSTDRALAAFEEGREAFWNYLSLGNDEHAQAAAEAGVQAGELSRRLAEKTTSKWRMHNLNAAADGLGEWAEGVLRTAELQGQVERAGKELRDADNAAGERFAAARERAQAACAAASHDTAGFAQLTMIANFVVAGLAALGGLAVAFGLGGSLSRAGSRVVETMRAVCAGDLTRPPLNERRGDEIGELARAMDELSAGLRDVVEEVAVSSADVVGAAGKVAANASELSKSVDEMVRGVARASNDAANTGEAARAGSESAARTAEAFRTAGQAVASAAQLVAEVGLRGEQIGKAVGELQELSDRMNLSAMNASIEAAKSTEPNAAEGTPSESPTARLTTVAAEMRSLSERTTTAVEAVSQSIRNIRDEIGRAIERATGGGRHIDQGIAEAERTGECIDRLGGDAGRVAETVRRVCAVGDEASAIAGRSTTGVAELSAKAEQLMSTVKRFKYKQGAPAAGAQ